MPIVAPTPPEGCREAVAEALKLRLERRALAGLRGALGVSLGIQRLRVPHPAQATLARAELISWDFFVIGSNDTALASARPMEASCAFAGITRGAFAERALQAASLADARFGQFAADYRPLFIESPAAATFSLLLKPSRGAAYFIDILDRVLVPAGQLYIQRGANRLLGRIAARSIDVTS